MDSSIIYSRQIILHAAKSCYLNMMWVYCIVGAPPIYFGLSGTIFTKAAFFFLGSLVFWLPLFLACIFFHGRSLKTDEEVVNFNVLTDKAKGKVIGEYIS